MQSVAANPIDVNATRTCERPSEALRVSSGRQATVDCRRSGGWRHLKCLV
jgi:hypothetical protein